MNYEEWANEYFNEANNLKLYIKNLRNQLNTNVASEIKDLNSRISILYPIYLELLHTSRYISNLKRREKSE